ncbi:hypothetical protein AAGG74_19000 [Bacillus mexicanus]|uniref:hypothetical protein n=1 Tax=Bacillus mexicanus TaxID=2834415 RepID=UPI003D196E23
MERIEISLEAMFELVKQSSENIGHYDPISETLSIFPHEKDELLETIQSSIEDYISKELEGDVEEELVDFTEDDTFLLSDDDEDDDDDDDEDDEE